MFRHTIFLIFLLVFVPGLGFCETLELTDKDILEVDLGPIPGHIKPPTKHPFGTLQQQSTTAPPLVLLLHVGYKGFSAPDDAVFECWDNFDSYSPGDLIYFGFIVANFEPVKKTVVVQLELAGGKTIHFKGKRTVPAFRGRAYFIRKTLGNSVAAYELAVGLADPKTPATIYDVMLARFIINQIF